jgi:hypothetical protein
MRQWGCVKRVDAGGEGGGPPSNASTPAKNEAVGLRLISVECVSAGEGEGIEVVAGLHQLCRWWLGCCSPSCGAVSSMFDMSRGGWAGDGADKLGVEDKE